MKKENSILKIIIFVLSVLLLLMLIFSFRNCSYGISSLLFPIFLFGFLFMILVLVALVLFISWLIKQLEK